MQFLPSARAAWGYETPMARVPTVKRVMSPFPYSLDAGADLAAATAMMEQHDVRHLPVTHDGVVIGVLSQRELAVAMAVGDGDALVGDVCTPDPYIVEHDTPADVVARTMAGRRIGSTVVLHHGKLAGIVTTVDVCSAYAALLGGDEPPDDAVA